MNQKHLYGMVITVVIIEIIILIIGSFLALINVFRITNGCFLRYNFAEDGSLAGGEQVNERVTVAGNANYNMRQVATGSNKLVYDEKSYGKWVKAPFFLQKEQPVTLQVNGKVTLCRGHLQLHNTQADGNTDQNGKVIGIPRLDEDPLTILLDAKRSGWNNLLEVYKGDDIKVTLLPEQTTQYTASGDAASNVSLVPYTDIFTGQTVTADCSENQENYSPICGKMTFWPAGSIPNGCGWGPVWGWGGDANGNAGNCPARARWHGWPVDEGALWFMGWSGRSPDAGYRGGVWGHWPSEWICGSFWQAKNQNIFGEYKGNGTGIANCSAARDMCITYADAAIAERLQTDDELARKYGYASAGISTRNNYAVTRSYNGWGKGAFNLVSKGSYPYKEDGSRTSSSFSEMNDFECDGENNRDQPQAEKPKPWVTADNPIGLYYRYAPALAPSIDQVGGANTTTGVPTSAFTGGAAVKLDRTNPDNRAIISYNYGDTTMAYLQFGIYNPIANGNLADGTGGYALQIQQNKCIRENGDAYDDKVPDRGRVLMLLLPADIDPNSDDYSAYTVNRLAFNSKQQAAFNTDTVAGYLWFKIYNADDDYKDSTGEYDIDILTTVHQGTFGAKILSPIIEAVRTHIINTSYSVFKNMTCYQTGMVTSSCTNLFNYLRAMLTLHIMFYGFAFLMGSTEISQKDLVTRVVKIAIVSGLINGSTFEYFSLYVFPLVVNFSDQIIENMSGFKLYSENNTPLNPAMFLDNLLTHMFFTKTFIGKVTATLSMGLMGPIYFMIVMLCVILFVKAALQAIATYLMATIALAVLISLSPIFLSFILFERTYQYFDTWVKMMIRFMMEPVVLFAGLIVLTQLFTIALDTVLSYSVCWKCVLNFKLPFSGILPLPGISGESIFCVRWFGVWGINPVDEIFSMGLSEMFGLVIIAVTIFFWNDFASDLTKTLTPGGGDNFSARQAGAGMKDFAKVISQMGKMAKSTISKRPPAQGQSINNANTQSPAAKDKAQDQRKEGKEESTAQRRAGQSDQLQKSNRNRSSDGRPLLGAAGVKDTNKLQQSNRRRGSDRGRPMLGEAGPHKDASKLQKSRLHSANTSNKSGHFGNGREIEKLGGQNKGVMKKLDEIMGNKRKETALGGETGAAKKIGHEVTHKAEHKLSRGLGKEVSGKDTGTKIPSVREEVSKGTGKETNLSKSLGKVTGQHILKETKGFNSTTSKTPEKGNK